MLFSLGIDCSKAIESEAAAAGGGGGSEKVSRRVIHFLCDECFDQSVFSQLQAVDTFKSQNCTVCCLYCYNPHYSEPPSSEASLLCRFKPSVVSRHVSQETFDLYIKTKEEIDRADAASNAEVQIRRDIAEAAVDRNKRIDMHRKAIEELLLLLCPVEACKAKIDMNFDGCLAVECLTCHNEFCAWCFRVFFTNGHQHTHNDTVQHVRACELNPYQGDVSRGREIIKQHTNQRLEGAFRILLLTCMPCSHTLPQMSAL